MSAGNRCWSLVVPLVALGLAASDQAQAQGAAQPLSVPGTVDAAVQSVDGAVGAVAKPVQDVVGAIAAPAPTAAVPTPAPTAPPPPRARPTATSATPAPAPAGAVAGSTAHGAPSVLAGSAPARRVPRRAPVTGRRLPASGVSLTPRPTRTAQATPPARRPRRRAARVSPAVRRLSMPTTIRRVVLATPTWLWCLLGLLGGLVLVMLAVLVRSRRRFERAHSRAYTDALTGVGNRAAADVALARLTAQSDRNGSTLAAVLIDVDHFKAVNDEFGHAEGDRTLQRVAETLAARVRAGDVLCRYGGEEFLLLAPDTTVDGAMTLAEGLRRDLHTGHAGSGPAVTASFGVAAARGSEGAAAHLVAAADSALYRAKGNGRDRVEGVSATTDAAGLRWVAVDACGAPAQPHDAAPGLLPAT